MVLLEGIAAAALVPLQAQPHLQERIVCMMIWTVAVLTAGIIILIAYFAVKNPGLLFSPADIDPAVHDRLYVPLQVSLTARGASDAAPPVPANGVEFTLLDEAHNSRAKPERE